MYLSGRMPQRTLAGDISETIGLLFYIHRKPKQTLEKIDWRWSCIVLFRGAEALSRSTAPKGQLK